MPDPLVIARSSHAIGLLPNFANRHGLITGATGTGKTVTLQVLAERFSSDWGAGVHGRRQRRLVGLSIAGSPAPKLKERLAQLGLEEPPWTACSGYVLGYSRKRRSSGAGNDIRYGAAAARAVVQSERYSAGRADDWYSRSRTTMGCCCLI